MASLSAVDDECGVIKETIDTPPAHYLYKVESFSLFRENGVDKVKSNKFQIGEHQWKLLLKFPQENNEGEDNHISIYLMLASTSDLPAGETVNATFKFFLLDQIRGKYLTVQGRARRFDRIKYEWGFNKFISLEEFEEPSNGFLVDDTCFFGVEVCLTEKRARIGECLKISKVNNISGKYIWSINQFSKLGKCSYSEEFVVGGFKWKVLLYPNGNSEYEGFSLSLYLYSVDSVSSTTEHNVKAEFTLTLRDERNKNHKMSLDSVTWFGASTVDWGWSSFIELKDLKDGEKGYIVEDRCIIEAQVKILCKTSRITLNC